MPFSCILCSMSEVSSGNTSGELSIPICTHLANQAAIHPSAHPCIYSLVHHSTRPPIYPSSRNPLCNFPRAHPSVHSSLPPSIRHPPIHPFVHPYTRPSVHSPRHPSVDQSMHPSIHPSESLASIHNRPRRNARSENNYAKTACKKRDTGGAQNWPRRFAPRPILGVGGVAFCCVQFWYNFGVIVNQIVQ